MNESFMFTWSSLTTLLMFVVVCLYLRLLTTKLKANSRFSLPGPKGWPIVGSALSIGRDAHVTFTEWAKEYGAVIGVKIGPMSVVVLNDVYSIQSTFGRTHEITDRPVPGLLKAAFSNDGSLLWQNGRKWSKTRKFVLRYLYNFKQHKLHNLLEVENRQLCKTIKQQTGSFNTCELLNMAVSNILCAVCFGKRFVYEDEKFRSLLNNLNELGKSVSGTTIGHFLPFLYYTPLYKDFRRLATKLSDFIDDEIVKHVETFDRNRVRDLIDAFLLEESDTELPTTQSYVRRAVIDMFASGTETTSNALCWAILYMTQYKDAQAAVQEELDTVMSEGSLPLQTLSSYYNSLPYTRATLMEVLRLANISPLGLPRKVSEQTSIEGYRCERGTWVFANLWSVHHDETYWENPKEFQPKRFLSDNNKSIILSKAFMPFGLGKRFCVGEQVAMATMLVIFSKLLQEFSFCIPEDDTAPSFVGINGLTHSPRPFKVNAIQR